MSVGHAMEHAEHISHSGHGGHGGHGDERLGTYVGVTMAILGVLLALCSALVGAERTLLVEKLVEQQHAHAKYQAQDVKHRAAVLALQQVHATAFAGATPTARKDDVLRIIGSVERYLSESVAAKEWTESYDRLIAAHIEAQEEYEHGLLAAEIGIVIASIALLMRRRLAWYAAVVLGLVCIVLLVRTALHTSHAVKESKATIQAAKARYEGARKGNKSTDDEKELVKSMLDWAKAN